MMMRDRFILPAIVLMLVFGLAHGQSVPERWEFQKDEAAWSLSREAAEEGQVERVYARQGENAYFWTELITTGYQRTESIPDAYIVAFVNDLLERCRPLKIAPVEQAPTNIIFEWQGDCRVVGAEAEIRRVTIERDGIHYIAYAAKQEYLTADKRDHWLSVIRNAKLKSR